MSTSNCNILLLKGSTSVAPSVIPLVMLLPAVPAMANLEQKMSGSLTETCKIFALTFCCRLEQFATLFFIIGKFSYFFSMLKLMINSPEGHKFQTSCNLVMLSLFFCIFAYFGRIGAPSKFLSCTQCVILMGTSKYTNANIGNCLQGFLARSWHRKIVCTGAPKFTTH